MPEYWTWLGRSTSVWGNVHWGSSGTGTYTIDFGDGSPVASGTVTDSKYISVAHTYATVGSRWASVSVTDGNGLSDEQQIRIYVAASPDVVYGRRSYEANAALEDGLRWLYLNQNSSGYWNFYGRPIGETATAILAFQEHGHRA